MRSKITARNGEIETEDSPVHIKKNRSRASAAIVGVCVLALATSACGGAQEQPEQAQGQSMQTMDEQGASLFQVEWS